MKNIVLKKSTQTKHEHNILKLLMFICLISFFVSLFLELYVVCKLDRLKFHIDFIENVLIGISASTIVSFIPLYFSFKKHINSRLELIQNKDNCIYMNYSELIFCINNARICCLSKSVDDVFRAINDLKSKYSTTEFYVDKTSNFISKIDEKLIPILRYIQFYDEAINLFVDKKELIEKACLDSYKYEKLMEEIYGELSKYIDENLPIEFLSQLFDSTDVLSENNNKIVKKLAELDSDIKRCKRQSVEFADGVLIRKQIVSIVNKYLLLD